MTEKEPKKVAEQAEEEQKQVDDGSQERVHAFLVEYGELVKKHNIDFASYPVFVPDGQGGFKVIVQNTPVNVENVPKKSPFVAGE